MSVVVFDADVLGRHRTGDETYALNLLRELGPLASAAGIRLVARDPRGWRRLYQAKFEREQEFSVNRNKRLDEEIKKRCIPVAMVFLTAAVGAFILGITHRYRNTPESDPPEDRFRKEDAQRVLPTAGKNR